MVWKMTALRRCGRKVSATRTRLLIGLRTVFAKSIRLWGGHLEHIKGLEFEAVFYISLDQTIGAHPDLFAKFLYVGATRAATYLGVTFSAKVPQVFLPLSDHFRTEGWL